MSKPIVAIVGRPNVGKSTLFNRLVGKRIAIVEDEPGITRDRIYADTDWSGKEFTLIDTGGIEFTKTDKITAQMYKQAQLAIEEADVIVFIVDAREGVTPTDEEVAQILRRANKPVVLGANKGEVKEEKMNLYDFYTLGLGEPVLLSAVHGIGTGDLLDEIVSHLPEEMPDPYDEDTIKVSIIGRPNVGKSSLLNALIGEERVIVSDIAGTTRDAIDTLFEKNGEKFVFIDTAGMRRKSKIEDPVERYSVIRSLRAVDRSTVSLIVIEGPEGVTEQDKKVAGYAHEQGNASIIVVNKWDLVEKDEKTMQSFTKKIKNELAFMHYAPVVFVSALTKQRVAKIFEMIVAAADQHARRVTTSTLNEVIKEATIMHAPPSDKGKRLKIFYATQVGVQPPTMALFVNEPELMHFSYLRYIENKLREAFGFEGTPMNLTIRKRD